jgi:hypothetical protein
MSIVLNSRLRQLKQLSLIVAVAVAGQASAATFTNGDFEAGNFSNWTRYGFTGQHLTRDDANHTYQNYLINQTGGPSSPETNAVVTQQTTAFDGFGTVSPAINPTQGSFLAYLSNETSAGNNTLAGSAISQTFTVPAGATSLTYNVRLLSNEDLDSQWDFGGVALLQGTTLSSAILAQFNLDHDPTLGTSAANAHATAIAAGGFDDSTAWLSQSFNLTGLDGQNLTVIAYVTNTQDISAETRLLLDNMRVNAVPEPSTIILLGVAVATLAASRARQQRGTN